jgi:hypothetical protein
MSPIAEYPLRLDSSSRAIMTSGGLPLGINTYKPFSDALCDQSLVVRRKPGGDGPRYAVSCYFRLLARRLALTTTQLQYCVLSSSRSAPVQCDNANRGRILGVSDTRATGPNGTAAPIILLTKCIIRMFRASPLVPCLAVLQSNSLANSTVVP